MALDVSSIQNAPLPSNEAGKAHAQAVALAAQAAGAPQGLPANAEPPKPIIATAELQSMIKDMERVSGVFNRRLSFSVNEKLDQVIVKVIDADTDKVVREIPPAELQHVYERIREVIGLLFDTKA